MTGTKLRLHGAAWSVVTLLLGGCPDAPGPVGPGTEDQARPAADLGCYAQPRTHVELLNACTTAQSVDKQPVLPLLRRDGTLPPLP